MAPADEIAEGDERPEGEGTDRPPSARPLSSTALSTAAPATPPASGRYSARRKAPLPRRGMTSAGSGLAPSSAVARSTLRSAPAGPAAVDGSETYSWVPRTATVGAHVSMHGHPRPSSVSGATGGLTGGHMVVPTTAAVRCNSARRRPLSAPQSLQQRARLLQHALAQPGALPDASPAARAAAIHRFATCRPSSASAAPTGQPHGPGAALTGEAPPAWLHEVARRVAHASPLPPAPLLRLLSTLSEEQQRAEATAATAAAPPPALGETVLQHFERQAGPVARSAHCAARLAELVASLLAHASAIHTVRSFAMRLGVLQVPASAAVLTSARAERQPDASGWGAATAAPPARRWPPRLPETAVVTAAVEHVAASVLAVPCMPPVLAAVAAASFVPLLTATDLGTEIGPGHGAALDWLLLEAAQLLRVAFPPQLFLLPSATAGAHFLSVPLHATLPPAEAPAAAPPATWRRRPVLIVTTAAVATLGPWELQALLAATLTPHLAPAGAGHDAGGDAARPPTLPLAVLATAATLAHIAPHTLLPTVPHGSEAAWQRHGRSALLRAGSVLGSCGDRAALLVAQVCPLFARSPTALLRFLACGCSCNTGARRSCTSAGRGSGGKHARQACPAAGVGGGQSRVCRRPRRGAAHSQAATWHL